MTSEQPWSDAQKDAMRSILTSWGELSRDDVTLITNCVRDSNAVVTLSGTAYARFWTYVATIGWAEPIDLAVEFGDVPPQIDLVACRLKKGGAEQVARFLVTYDLLNMGSCTPRVDSESLDAQTAHLARAPAIKARQTKMQFAIQAWSYVAALMVGMCIGGVLGR